MTCIDKLKELHPDWDDGEIRYYVENHCVTSEYIMPRDIHCGAHGWEESEDCTCEKCWNREIYEDERCNKHDTKVYLTGEDMRRLGRLVKRTGYSRDKVVSAALLLYEDGLNAVDESLRRYSSMSFEGVDVSGGI